MHFYLRTNHREKSAEPAGGRPAGSAEEWLGRNRVKNNGFGNG